MQVSQFYNNFKGELVQNSMWMTNPETSVADLTTELCNCSSSRNERVKLYNSLVQQKLITEFESLMMEIDYCTYVNRLGEEINHRNWMASVSIIV
jgi:hypothetical protein